MTDPRDVCVCIPCVNYDDFLARTLDRTVEVFPRTWVVTAPSDRRSITVSRQYGAKTFITDVWWQDGASFDKGAAINEWVLKCVPSASCWILILDADIYLPPGIEERLQHLKRHVLYSAQRRMCLSETEWHQFCSGQLSIWDFPVSHIPIKDGKAWGHKPTSNPAGLQGYFQLFFLNEQASKKEGLFSPSGSAENYDLEFALRYPGWAREYLSGYEVIHLGKPKANWNGRVTRRWNDEGLLRPATDS